MSDSNQEYLNWFKRQAILPEIGQNGQLKLKQSKVIIVGAGGLGCPVSLYLSAAGVGNITIVDGDRVEKSNLHRQVLFSPEDIGEFKAETAVKKLQKQSPWTTLKFKNEFITVENINTLKDYDLAIDGSDNFATKYLLNDASHQFGIPYLSCSIDKFKVQLGLFNTKKGATYRCLFPEPPAAAGNCAENGVLGPAVGVAGSYQALEALKHLSGINTDSGDLVTIDLLKNTSQQLSLPASKSGLKESYLRAQDYYNQLGGVCSVGLVQSLSLEELKEKQAAGQSFTLVDVRSKEEHNQFNIGGALIPHQQLLENPELLPSTRPLVLYCQTGRRSTLAALALDQTEEVYSLSLD